MNSVVYKSPFEGEVGAFDMSEIYDGSIFHDQKRLYPMMHCELFMPGAGTVGSMLGRDLCIP